MPHVFASQLHIKVYLWGCGKSESFGKFDKVKFVDVEDVLLRVACISLNVGSKGVLCSNVEEVVLFDQVLKLGLDVRKFVFWKFVFVERDF